MTDLVTREQKINESVQRYAEAQLVARGYPADKLQFIDDYPWGMAEPVAPGHAMIATGFDLDDEGRQAEMGSDLIERQYTIQLWTFAATNVTARNVAHALKFALEHDGTIPLLDISAEGAPEIDRLVVEGVTAERQPFPDPEPWQENVWTTTVSVRDVYFASLV